ncbi:hypothetical protein F2Q68_00014080 [Brassica cretica]|uniref:Uncharacterized protein n=1 Tax=Brassica cretica TaxID=69181 RepID=A0A8S9HQA9_BRACR|nr:hypothetical protein F2Q68_00014080 [Brassica cretica]
MVLSMRPRTRTWEETHCYVDLAVELCFVCFVGTGARRWSFAAEKKEKELVGDLVETEVIPTWMVLIGEE